MGRERNLVSVDLLCRVDESEIELEGKDTTLYSYIFVLTMLVHHMI